MTRGPASGLYVSSFVFSLMAIGLYVMGFVLAPKYGWTGTTPNSGSGAEGAEARCANCRSKLAVCVCKDKDARRGTGGEAATGWTPTVKGDAPFKSVRRSNPLVQDAGGGGGGGAAALQGNPAFGFKFDEGEL